MKKIFFLTTFMLYAIIGHAQDSEPGRWFAGVNFKAGVLKEQITLQPIGWLYPNTLNAYRPKLKIENDNPYGFDVQLGFFFSPDRRWGISTGLVYFRSEAVVTFDSIHFEYRSLDFNKDTFRQVISTSQPISEVVKTTNISVPLLLKYRTMLSKRIGFTVDAGILYNVKIESTYNGDAAFNYEAIYRFEKKGDQYVAVYDNSPVPADDAWLITAKEYNEDKGDGNAAAYFQTLQDQGYNVGLNEKAKSSGTVTHKTGSIGILIQPAISFKLSDVFSMSLGPYYMFQRFNNTEENQNIRLTDKIGEYNSILNSPLKRRFHNYGLSLGLNLYL